MDLQSILGIDIDEIDRNSVRLAAKEKGIAQGVAETELRNNELTKRLISSGRTEDLLRAADDPEYKKLLYKEFGLLKEQK